MQIPPIERARVKLIERLEIRPPNLPDISACEEPTEGAHGQRNSRLAIDYFNEDASSISRFLTKPLID
jgi:hypothetical protein